MVDIRKPANPKLVASVGTPGEAKGVYAISSFTYVADGSAGLQIVDIRDPVTPKNPLAAVTKNAGKGTTIV